LDEKEWKRVFQLLAGKTLKATQAYENAAGMEKAVIDAVFFEIEEIYIFDPQAAIDIAINIAKECSKDISNRAIRFVAEKTKIELPEDDSELGSWLTELGLESFKEKALKSIESAKSEKPETPTEESETSTEPSGETSGH
jgi:hypothetical protein